jgi:DNA-binding CsgD family transcriptional regulator
MREALGRRYVIVVMCAAVECTTESRVPAYGLTPREDEVAALIAIGRATKEIAAELSISTHTARHHTERVFAKLGVQSRAAVASIVGAGLRMGRSSHLMRLTGSEE